MACGFFATNSISLGFLPILAKFEAIFATIVCLYVLVRFVINFVKAK